MSASPFPEALPISEYQLSYRTSLEGVVTLNMPADGSSDPVAVRSRPDAHFFQYSPDGKYLALVVADMDNAVVSAARVGLQGKTPGPGVAPEAVAVGSSVLHPATPRWIEIVDTTTFQTVHTLQDVAGIEEHFYWSPKGRYLVTWQPLFIPRPAFSGPETSATSGDFPNLKIWDIVTGKVVLEFKYTQRAGWPIMRWTDDEKIAARFIAGKIQLYNWQTALLDSTPEINFSKMHSETIEKSPVADWSITRSAIAIYLAENPKQSQPAHVHIYPLTPFTNEEAITEAVAPTTNNQTTTTPSNSSTPKKSGAKKTSSPSPSIPLNQQPKEPDFMQSSKQKEQHSDTDQSAAKPTATKTLVTSSPIATKSFFQCDEIKFNWHNRGQALLIFASTQRDQSGANHYYGNTFLYYLASDGKYDASVVLDKPGPIQDAKWNAKGNDFAVTYGNYPAKTTLFNRKCKALGHLGTDSRNTILWSPQGRVMMCGGFGQLPGDFDIWDTAKLQKVGSGNSFCAGFHEWSPDGKLLVTAALWPRMRVDNYIRIYDLAANILFNQKLTEVWKVQWRPAPGCASAYPAPTDDIVVPKPAKVVTLASSTASAKPTASGGAYKHPHWKKTASSSFAQSQIPKEQKEQATRYAQPSNPNQNRQSSPNTTPSTSKVPVGFTPVGFTPVAKKSGGNKSKGPKK